MQLALIMIMRAPMRGLQLPAHAPLQLNVP